MRRGRPKTKKLTVFKKLDPKFKVKLDHNTTVYVKSMEIVNMVWKPRYPNLEVMKWEAA